MALSTDLDCCLNVPLIANSLSTLCQQRPHLDLQAVSLAQADGEQLEGTTMHSESFDIKFARRRLNFDDQSTRAYFLETPPQIGDSLIIYMGQGHMNHYRLARVSNVRLTKNGAPSKIYLDKSGSMGGGSAFWITGKNYAEPTGQTKLVPLVPTLASLLSYDRDIILSDAELRSLLSA